MADENGKRPAYTVGRKFHEETVAALEQRIADLTKEALEHERVRAELAAHKVEMAAVREVAKEETRLKEAALAALEGYRKHEYAPVEFPKVLYAADHVEPDGCSTVHLNSEDEEAVEKSNRPLFENGQDAAEHYRANVLPDEQAAG